MKPAFFYSVYLDCKADIYVSKRLYGIIQRKTIPFASQWTLKLTAISSEKSDSASLMHYSLPYGFAFRCDVRART